MIRLTDRQLAQLMDSARQIQRPLRDQFLRDVAAALDGRDFGDGDVSRAIRVALQQSRGEAREA
jgi:hypothetical protein